MRKKMKLEERAAVMVDIAEHLNRDLSRRQIAQKWHQTEGNIAVMATLLRKQGISIPKGWRFRRPARRASSLALALQTLKEKRGTLVEPQGIVQGVVRRLTVSG